MPQVTQKWPGHPLQLERTGEAASGRTMQMSQTISKAIGPFKETTLCGKGGGTSVQEWWWRDFLLKDLSQVEVAVGASCQLSGSYPALAQKLAT